MYNLIIGYLSGEADASRMLEYTDEDLKEWLEPDRRLDPVRLRDLPTLLLPEPQDTSSEQVAHVGHIEDLVKSGRAWRFRFVPSEVVGPFTTDQIVELGNDLQITDWEFNRTHWAVKNVDLYRVLISDAPAEEIIEPKIFRLPTHVPREDDLAVVMMPFAKNFDPVYAALKDAAAELGMRCHRADDIWENDHIIEDIIGLIWRARIVIADLTGKNTNVFYETGIAHTLGRETIQISQSADHVPFDLSSVRTLFYLPNEQGLDVLRTQIVERVRYLTTEGLAR